MKLGILQTGRAPEELKDKHGDYDRMFEQLLKDGDFTFETYAALDNHLPSSPHDAQGWIITGSKFGVYEDLPWIPRLEAFIRDCFAQEVPMAGFCFGHQIMAQALGGRVEKFDGGWSVGNVEYQNDTGQNLSVMAFHQDQVLDPPKGAKPILSSDFCQYAGLSYGAKGFSLQPHPEFDAGFVGDLLDVRGKLLNEHEIESARGRLKEKVDRSKMAQMIIQFFKSSQSAGEHAAS